MARVSNEELLAKIEVLHRDLGLGQGQIEKRMTLIESQMAVIVTCVTENAKDIAIVKDDMPECKVRIGKLEDREREGAIKQAGLSATIAGIVAYGVGAIKEMLARP